MPPGQAGERWKDRRVLAASLGVAIALFPVGCSIGVALGIQRLIAAPSTVIGFGAWWLGTLAVCTVVFFASERTARRVVPLTVLLKMGMAFPGRAPKRLAVARRAGSVRDLQRRVDEARTRGMNDSLAVAVEKIVTLATMLSVHDRTTRGHAERVRALTDMIAEEMRLPQVHRDRLRWSSLLHDIGKLTVHPDTLNKPGKLNAEEWEIIKRHPLEGARLTAPIAGWLGEWANTIAEHHERFDGRGYPYGVAGRQISLGGRIVAVADSYDVMTSARSYKKATTPEKARQELAACAGSQFDPDVVRAFLAVSVWRLRLAAPFSWLGSLPSTKVVAVVSRLGSVGGHSVVAGLAAGVGVLGLTAAAPVVSSASPPAPVSQNAPAGGQGSPTGNPGNPAGAVTRAAGTSSATTGGGTSNASISTTSRGTSGSRPSSTTTTTTAKSGAGSGSAATTTPSPTPGTTNTTAPSKGNGNGNSSGSGNGTGMGNGGPSATTTTTTTAPVPQAPSGLQATGACQVLVIGPEVSLTWIASPSSFVTSYSVMRRSGGGTFLQVAQVSSGTTSYADTSLSGLGTSYTYEIVANAPGGTAASASASATTPALCL